MNTLNFSFQTLNIDWKSWTDWHLSSVAAWLRTVALPAAIEWVSDCSECPQFNPISAPTTVHHPPKYPFNAPWPRQMYPRISMNRRKSSSFMVLAGNHNRCLGRLLSSGNGRSWSGRLPKWALIDFNFVVTMPARQGATKKTFLPADTKTLTHLLNKWPQSH